MGTMEEALLQDHGTEMEIAVMVATEPSSTGVWSKSLASACLSCRSGDDMADGGHMIVPSIGHSMPLMSSANCAPSFDTDRFGSAHMVPMTWQRAKNSTRAMDCVLALAIMQLFIA